MYVIFNFADPIIFNVIIYQCKIIRPENVYLFTCALICRLSTYLLSGKPYSSKGHDSSTMKGKNPYFVSTSCFLRNQETHFNENCKSEKLKRVRWLKILRLHHEIFCSKISYFQCLWPNLLLYYIILSVIFDVDDYKCGLLVFMYSPLIWVPM